MRVAQILKQNPPAVSGIVSDLGITFEAQFLSVHPDYNKVTINSTTRYINNEKVLTCVKYLMRFKLFILTLRQIIITPLDTILQISKLMWHVLKTWFLFHAQILLVQNAPTPCFTVRLGLYCMPGYITCLCYEHEVCLSICIVG